MSSWQLRQLPAVSLGGDDESVVIFLLLAGGGLVALQAVHAFARVRAHLILVHDGVLRARVTFRAFPGGANQVRRWPVPSPLWAARG